MRNHQLLTMAAVASLMLAGWLGYVALRLSARDCSMSNADRVALVQRLDPARVERLLERVLGSAGSNRGLTVNAPATPRDFALDQGPQRVCASGAAHLPTSGGGDVNVLVRVYDSAAAANANARSNLAVTLATATYRQTVSGATCTRADVDGCREYGAQAIAGEVSVVVLSRSLPPSEVEVHASELAGGLAELIASRAD